MKEGFVDFADRDDIVRIVQVAGELFGVADGVSRGIGRGKQDSANVFTAQCFTGQGEGYGAVDAAAAGNDSFFEAQLGEIVADAKDQRLVDLPDIALFGKVLEDAVRVVLF